MKLLFVTLLLVTLLAPGASASVYTVYADGSGSYPTIQAAVNASVEGDTIRLGDGTFSGTGNRDLQVDRPRVFLSASGDRLECILDAGGLPFGDLGVDPDESETFRFENITFRAGSAFDVRYNKVVELTGCRFENCTGLVTIWPYVIPSGRIIATGCSFHGGGGSLSAHVITLTNCDVIARQGGIADASYLTANDCRFMGNNNSDGGGSLFRLQRVELYDCVYELVDCWFFDNAANALIRNLDGQLTLTGCSFVYGNGPGGVDLAVEWPEASTLIERCIFAHRSEGGVFAIEAGASIPQLTNCDIYANIGGNWVGPIADQYGVGCNMSADPQFCDWPSGNLTLFNTSPCLPANNSCGVLIGAEGQGCTDPTAVEAAPGGGLRLSAAPNPFNPKTRLSFSLPEAARVSLAVFDASGRRVATLLDGAPRPAGEQAVDWDARGLASGVYLARLGAGSLRQETKLTLLR